MTVWLYLFSCNYSFLWLDDCILICLLAYLIEHISSIFGANKVNSFNGCCIFLLIQFHTVASLWIRKKISNSLHICINDRNNYSTSTGRSTGRSNYSIKWLTSARIFWAFLTLMTSIDSWGIHPHPLSHSRSALYTA